MNDDSLQNNTITAPLLPYQFAKKHEVLAHLDENGKLAVLHMDVIQPIIFNELRRFLNAPFSLRRVNRQDFQKHLATQYETDSHAAMQMMAGMEEELDLSALAQNLPTTQDLLDTQDDAPIIRLLNALFSEAIKQKASDIHIESFANKVLIRIRIDGVLRQALEISPALGPLLISRVKVMAKLDIAEKRLPQDGHLSLSVAGHKIDVRVSTLPSSHAERVVLRILDKNVANLQLDLLGMADDDLNKVKSLLKNPHGIILVTGPTGSGKTTSLYAMLTDLNTVARNILTVEDPIEYDLLGIGQTQVNSKVNMTFAKGLRAILRQDPDIIMVGEIRDLETAEIAVQASLTGHLVLSTLHTNTATGALTRLQDMGVQPFLLASSLRGIIAQRLVRTLCEKCKEPHLADSSELEILKRQAPVTLYTADGCEACQYQGYQGRSGIYEIIIIDQELIRMIHSKADEKQLEEYAHKFTPSIRQTGFDKVLKGKTSLEEVLRVTSEQ